MANEPKRPSRKGGQKSKAKAPKPVKDGAFFSPETAQTAHYKKPDNSEIIEALYECYGNVSLTAKVIGAGRRTVYEWIDKYPDLQHHLAQARRQAHDHVESKLMELINGVTVEQMTPDGPTVYTRPPDKTSIIFFLKCQAKWSEADNGEKDDNATRVIQGLAQLIDQAGRQHDHPREASAPEP